MKPYYLQVLTVVLASISFGATANDVDDATAHFEKAFAPSCMPHADMRAGMLEDIKSWELSWRYEYAKTDTTATLVKFFCSTGAYNVTHIYYLVDEYDGPMPISFAAPNYEIEYADDDFEAEVEKVTVRGFDSSFRLVNSEFDPQTQTVTSASYWRGIGDASSSGTWVFDEGVFVLKSYDLDASYDGEINPQTIVEYK